MSKNTAAVPTPTGHVASVVNFVEESCFTRDDQLRAEPGRVVFRLFSVGRALGAKIDVSFSSDWGVYYHGDDEGLMDQLSAAAPHVNWRAGMVYHRWHDQSRIQVLSSESGKIVAQLETRRYEGRSVRPEAVEAGHYGANVVTMDMLRRTRAEKIALQAQKAEVLAAQSALEHSESTSEPEDQPTA